MARVIKVSGGALAPADAQAAADAAKACRIVAFPTDTVYGIGSTGLVKAASRRIYQIKQRPSLKPLPVLVHSLSAARRWVEFTPQAESLARRFWPGALTLVLKPTQEGRLLTFPEYQTVAIRVPACPPLLQVIELSGIPWVSTSANMSGEPSLADAGSVARELGDQVDVIIDGGAAPGVESTIVDATSSPVRVLREGALKSADVLAAAEASA